MMLKLQRYNLNVIYKKGKELYLADALSRAHLPSTDWAETSEDYDVMTVEVLSSRRMVELRQETQADYLCRRLSEVVAKGWPDSSKKLPHDLRQFYALEMNSQLIMAYCSMVSVSSFPTHCNTIISDSCIRVTRA